MLANNAVSAVVGLIPFFGDIVLAVFKANSRNAALLEEFLRIRGEEALKQAAESQALQQANADTSRTGVGELGEKQTPKRESSGWFGRKGKGKDNMAIANSPPRMSNDSRFVEDVRP